MAVGRGAPRHLGGSPYWPLPGGGTPRLEGALVCFPFVSLVATILQVD